MNGVTLQNLVQVFKLLDSSKLRRYWIFVGFFCLLGFLDLIGVALIAVAANLSAIGIDSGSPGTQLIKLLEFFQLDAFRIQSQVLIIGTCAAFFLVFKSLLSMYLLKKNLVFLSHEGGQISINLFAKLLNGKIPDLQRHSSQEVIFNSTTGATSVTLGVFGGLANVVADLFLLVLMSIGLIVYNPSLALSSIILLIATMFLLDRKISVKNQNVSTRYTQQSILANEVTVEAIESYREIYTKNRLGFFSLSISKLRNSNSVLNAEQMWLPSIGKYVIEILVTVGGLALIGAQFYASTSSQAAGGVALFLAAITRISPAILRIQQSLVTMRTSLAMSKPVIEMWNTLKSSSSVPARIEEFSQIPDENFRPSVKISNLEYAHGRAGNFQLGPIDLEIPFGKTFAIVGPSGSGKSTLVDLILGIYKPDHGEVLIDNLSPGDTVQKYGGGIGYVPQKISIIGGTIRTNVALGFMPNEVPDHLIWEALEAAKLKTYVESLDNGLDSEVGFRGSNLSGGQTQRLGIARAILSRPKLLVLDEATSALDAETEKAISDFFLNMQGKCTMIIVAHRLSTIRYANSISYMEKGRVVHSGTFEELKQKVPDFLKQAKIMGL